MTDRVTVIGGDRKCFSSEGPIFPGEEKEVSKEDADALVKKGLAKRKTGRKKNEAAA